MTQKLFQHEARARNGRYRKAPACDACGKATNEAERYTDDAVCGGTDGPGFFLCHRVRCQAKLEGLSVDERRNIYTAQRAQNER